MWNYQETGCTEPVQCFISKGLIMSVRDVASTTVLCIKEFSRNIFLTKGKKVFEMAFIKRNKKQLILCLSVWLLAVLVGYSIFRNATGNLENNYYQVGMSKTKGLAVKTGTLLIEKDILSLNSAIDKAADDEGVIFAAILDYENRIVAHSNPDLIGRSFQSQKNVIRVYTMENGVVQEAFLPNNKPITTFSSNITYAGINIGKVYIGRSASQLYSTMQKYRTMFFWAVFLSIILLLVILIIIDHLTIAKATKDAKKVEGDTHNIGPYLLQKKIAQGGMAELFLAHYLREDGFRRTVAIKRVLPHLAENPEFIKMFIREARLAALLHHPNVVQITDFGKIQDNYFIAMEYINGRDLAEIMAKLKKGLVTDQTVFIFSEICRGLQYSHTKKDDKTGNPLDIVHRDISPQNILISFQGEVKISDFGISKARSEPSMTQAGVIKGKISYLSPEQVLGQVVDQRTDLYELGIVIYEILSAQKLYQLSSDAEAIRTIPTREITPIKELRPDIPDDLNSIVMKCLIKDKEERYQSAQEILDDLNLFKHSHNLMYDASALSDFMKRNFEEG